MSWAQIVEYTTIGEFELLRTGARQDIRNLEWVDARNREATICYLKMVRAQEEITRLNVEAKRLATWIIDEKQVLEGALTTTQDTLQVGAIRAFAKERLRINSKVQSTLDALYEIKGFSGDVSIGTRNTANEVNEGVAGLTDAMGLADEEEDSLLDEVFQGVLSLTADE
jgi:hypothetical protein